MALSIEQQNHLKQQAAQAAMVYVPQGGIIGVGTGSTVNYLIDLLITKNLTAAVASSIATEQRLKAHGIPVLSLNDVTSLAVYIDGADEITPALHMIKGGGAALTREKIVASVAKQFVCLADSSKWVPTLGSSFALPVEVIPMATNSVMRQLTALGGRPVVRSGVITDNNNSIIDVYDWAIVDPITTETTLNNIVGVVCHGIFAQRGADIALIAAADGVSTYRV